MTTSKISKIVVGIILLISIVMAGSLFENNYAGFVQVKQSAVNGDMTVRLEPGFYPQMFGTITTYKVSDVYDFNQDQIEVRFNDASTAHVSGQIKFRLPVTEASILKLHSDFRSYNAVHADLVRQVVASSLKQSATFFRAEDIYSTRRSDFIDLVNDQIKEGIFATTYHESWIKDEFGEKKLVRNVEARRDKDGKPIINEQSAFAIYGIELVQLVINDVDFDDQTDALIAKRKEAEQERVVAVANAERAKQDAITAQEQGKANVAIAEAQALVEAKKQIVEAEKNTKVAEQKALQAEEEKKAIIAKGEADAAATKLKVAAGLSPLEAATIEKETAIGVAAQLAKIQLPKLMVLAGSKEGGGVVNPFDAVGLQSLVELRKQMSSKPNGPKW